MPSQNRKAADDEMENVRQVIAAAFPGLIPVFEGHAAYGSSFGRRHSNISFRLRDERGYYHSNVIWLYEESLLSLTADDIRRKVERANGMREKKQRR